MINEQCVSANATDAKWPVSNLVDCPWQFASCIVKEWSHSVYWTTLNNTIIDENDVMTLSCDHLLQTNDSRFNYNTCFLVPLSCFIIMSIISCISRSIQKTYPYYIGLQLIAPRELCTRIIQVHSTKCQAVLHAFIGWSYQLLVVIACSLAENSPFEIDLNFNWNNKQTKYFVLEILHLTVDTGALQAIYSLRHKTLKSTAWRECKLNCNDSELALALINSHKTVMRHLAIC